MPLKGLIGFAKRQTKATVGCVLKFESNLSEHAQKYEYDGVICGHCHAPEIKIFGDTRYTNCSDWMENWSEIVEHHGGSDSRSH